MKKQKLLNTPFKQSYLNQIRVRHFAFLFLLLGIPLPSFAQDVNPCSSIQVIGTSETDDGNGGAIFQGIVVSNEVTPNQAIKIYNENWEQINECSSNECGNPYTFATDVGKYFVQVQLFNEDETWLCQADPFEVTVSESGDPCQTFCQQAIIDFKSQADIDAFCGCEVLEGDVRINGEGSDITSLHNLKSIKKINGFLAIFNTDLVDFQGLDNLENTGDGFVIQENNKLQNYNGLGKLQSVQVFFSANKNPVLKSLEGLNNLQEINGSLDISSNDELIDISNLRNIKKLISATITGNKSLPNLEGLNNLKTLGDGTTQGDGTTENGGFTSLVIGGNAAIKNLDALSNLQLVTENLIIEFNDALEACCGIVHLIDDDPNNGNAQSGVSIKNNLSGCNSIEEVIANCQTTVPDCDNIALSINPNNVRTIDIAGLVTPHYIVKVYDEDWDQILSCTDDCTAVGEYEAGLYRIHVQLYDADWQYICETDFLEITIGGTSCDAPQAICQGDITLATQAEVDAFCGCEVIEGDLRIGATNPTDISSIRNLASLTKVTGFVAIFNTDLPQLYGLHNLKTIERDLILDKNRSLQHLNGLGELNTIGNGLIVNSNLVLETLDGLNHLTTLKTFNISDNPALISIQMLGNITEVNGFSIFANRTLASIEGLNSLVKVGNDAPSSPSAFTLGIGGNPMLTSLAPLANLREVNGNILIDGNTILANCCGISQLIDADPSNGQLLGAAQISNNGENCNSVEEVLAHCEEETPSCENITVSGQDGKISIDNLNAPIEIVKIYDENWNRVFECNADCGDPTIFETDAGKYYVQIQMYTADWKWICQTDNLEVTVTDGGNNCGTFCNQDQITLSTQAEVDAFCGCETISGDLIIGNTDNQAMTNITSLAPLKDLTSIAGNFFIYRTQIDNFIGLEGLTDLGGSILISNNPNITDMEGLGNIGVVNGALNISDNFALTSLDGLNLTSLLRFTSTNNPKLVNLNGLNTLTHLASIGLTGPHALTDLTGLENLTSLGEGEPTGYALLIVGTNNIVNLDALSNVTLVDGMLRIGQNMALSDCCGISHLLDGDNQNGTVLGTITLEGNPDGCNSVEEILENCANPVPTCDDIIVTISDLIIENGQSRREVSVTFNTPALQRTGLVLFNRNADPNDGGLLFNCGICLENQDFTLDEGEYVLLTERSYLNLNNGNLGCGDIIFIDVPATPCTDNDGDYICAYNECDDNDAEVTDLKRPVGTPCNDEDETTRDDVIQADGCTCAGTPISDNPCDDIRLSYDENSGGILVNGRSSQIQLITVYDSSWNKLWEGTCDKGDPLTTCIGFGRYAPGLYRVYVQMFDENWQYLCETDFLEIEIPEEGSSSRTNEDFIDEQALTLFPNPVRHTLKFHTTTLSGKKGNIQIFNTFGQQVGFIPQKEFSGTVETIDITGYQNGLYFMTIKMENHRAISKKFFVEKLE